MHSVLNFPTWGRFASSLPMLTAPILLLCTAVNGDWCHATVLSATASMRKPTLAPWWSCLRNQTCVNVSSAYFNLDIDKVRIRGDWAMAVVSRNENVGYIGNVQPQLYKNVVEAYILQKIDGDWRIENIIFSNGAPTDAIRTLIGPETSRADWEKDYCFKALRRADDLGEKNYSDYIQGNIEAPVLVME